MQLLMREFRSNKRLITDISSLPAGLPPPPISASHSVGLYAMLGDDCVGLLLIGGRLFVLWNGEALELSRCRDVQHTAEGGVRELRLTCGTRDLRSIYRISVPPVSTQFYSEDEEDADFGLWFRNVISSPARTLSIIRGWAKGIP